MKRILWLGIALVLLLPACGAAADWKPLDMGVGIYDDAEYDRVLKIVERGDTWVLPELYERGHLRGRGKVFGLWVAGPPVSSYLNANGVAKYGLKYRLTDPRGTSTVFGPYGFHAPGFYSGALNPTPAGEWRIDLLLWTRETGQETPIGTLRFRTTERRAAAAAVPGWSLRDAGVGIYDDGAYDTQLRIVERGDRWSLKALYDQGYLRGRGKVFGAWLAGPPVSSYLNANGIPRYGLKLRLTDPRGGATLFGPYGFYTPGFYTGAINPAQVGDWKVDFLLWTRETGQETPVQSIPFTITP